MSAPAANSAYMGSGDVAALYGVDSRTIINWADQPNSTFPQPVRTTGAHRRWPRAEIMAHHQRSRGMDASTAQRELFITWLRGPGWREFQRWAEGK